MCSRFKLPQGRQQKNCCELDHSFGWSTHTHTHPHMAASQNSRSGSTPKTHRRSGPAIQTDPDLTIQAYDPDPFVLSWLDIFFLQSTEKCYSALQSTTPVLLCTTRWSREFWKNLAIQIQTPFQASSMESTGGSVHSQPCCPRRKTGLCVQCRIIWFTLSRIWNDYHDSWRSVPDVRKRRFTKVVVPDVRITAERSRPVYRPMPILLSSSLDNVQPFCITQLTKGPVKTRSSRTSHSATLFRAPHIPTLYCLHTVYVCIYIYIYWILHIFTAYVSLCLYIPIIIS